jgi:hypothetical protein
MSLEMRSECERCGVGLTQRGVAFICSCGGTFCANCAGETDRVCGNCGGELVVRPRRRAEGT